MTSAAQPPPPVSASADRHLEEMRENDLHWSAKPALRAVYADFYDEIARWVNPAIPGAVLELGSGLGKIKTRLPQCLTSDIFPNPWLDRVESAYALRFPDGGLSHLILFDVWHHLEWSGDALREFRRALHPEGRLIVFEPAISWLGRIVYGLCHHEGLGLAAKPHWESAPADAKRAPGYFSSQSLASRIFWWRDESSNLARCGWRIEHRRVLPALDYVACGGFRGPSLSPPLPRSFFQTLNRLAGLFPRAFGTRLLVVLRPA